MNFFKKLFEQEPTIVPQTISLSTDVVVMEHPSSVEESNKLVQEIHDKVDWFAMYTKEIPNTLLDERLEKIQSIKSETLSYLERRERIGFALNEKQIQEKQQKLTEIKGIDLEIKEIEKEKNERKMLNDLRVKYPQRKFVHAKDMKDLCEKYSLSLGYTTHYTGDLPEKNLLEIEKYVKPKEALHIVKTYKSEVVYVPYTGTGLGRGQHYERKIEQFVITEIVEKKMDGVEMYLLNRTSDIEVNTFIIACPAKDLTQKIGESKVISMTPKDPIVMFPVGNENVMEIVTRWGLEASDPVLLNPNNN